MLEFKAYLVKETENGFVGKLENVSITNAEELEEGKVIVKIAFSSLNYKDALSSTGNKGVTRNYPHIPGIDVSGVVFESKDNRFKKGDEVIVTSYDLGMNTDGGFAEYVKVPADWVVKKPASISLRESMIYGTAGFTAGLSVYKLLKHAENNPKRVLVTGATGGVGSIAVALLKKVGFEVVALSGKKENEYLNSIGASEIITREDLMQYDKKPMAKPIFDAVIDTVGGAYVSAALKTTKSNGIVTTCGNVAGIELNTSIFPFILRGVMLIGIDSAECEMETRVKVWEHLATDWKIDSLGEIASEITLEEVENKIKTILEGGIVGRTLIKCGE